MSLNVDDLLGATGRVGLFRFCFSQRAIRRIAPTRLFQTIWIHYHEGLCIRLGRISLNADDLLGATGRVGLFRFCFSQRAIRRIAPTRLFQTIWIHYHEGLCIRLGRISLNAYDFLGATRRVALFRFCFSQRAIHRIAPTRLFQTIWIHYHEGLCIRLGRISLNAYDFLGATR